MNNSATASEMKFILEEAAAAEIRDWSLVELAADPNAADPRGDYRTASLYFDTENFDLFYRRGSTGRAKFRIRRYNDGGVVFLERKIRRGGRTTKRRSEIAVDELPRLQEDAGRWEGRWFEQRLRIRQLRPVCQIAYRRTARVGVSPSGPQSPLRLTLDRSLNAAAIDRIAFTDARGTDVLPGQAVLELKYPAAAPALFETLMKRFSLTPRLMSKYRMAVRALGLAGSDDLSEAN